MIRIHKNFGEKYAHHKTSNNAEEFMMKSNNLLSYSLLPSVPHPRENLLYLYSPALEEAVLILDLLVVTT